MDLTIDAAAVGAIVLLGLAVLYGIFTTVAFIGNAPLLRIAVRVVAIIVLGAIVVGLVRITPRGDLAPGK